MTDSGVTVGAFIGLAPFKTPSEGDIFGTALVELLGFSAIFNSGRFTSDFSDGLFADKAFNEFTFSSGGSPHFF